MSPRHLLLRLCVILLAVSLGGPSGFSLQDRSARRVTAPHQTTSLIARARGGRRLSMREELDLPAPPEAAPAPAFRRIARSRLATIAVARAQRPRLASPTTLTLVLRI